MSGLRKAPLRRGGDQQIVEELRSQEHDVTYIAEVAPGASDDEVFTRANETGSLLLTTDKDFGELVFRQRRILHGVLLIRLAGLSQRRKATTVASAIREFGGELEGAFAVVAPGRVRIRPVR